VAPQAILGAGATRGDAAMAYGVASLDLLDTIAQAAPTPDMRVYRVTVYGEDGQPLPGRAEALLMPAAGRIGIAWGGDATWADSTGDIERDLETWLNDPEAWVARN
jgi:hypothetical protein